MASTSSRSDSGRNSRRSTATRVWSQNVGGGDYAVAVVVGGGASGASATSVIDVLILEIFAAAAIVYVTPTTGALARS